MSIVQATIFPFIYLYTTYVGGRATASSRNDTRVTYDRGYGPWLSRKFGMLLLEKRLSSMREVENYHNPFTVAVVRSGVIVNHVPSLAISWLDALK